MSELKPCPFHDCNTCGCNDSVNIPDKEWNRRPEEERLRQENKILFEKANGLYLLLVDNPETRKLADKHLELVEILFRDTSGEG